MSRIVGTLCGRQLAACGRRLILAAPGKPRSSVKPIAASVRFALILLAKMLNDIESVPGGGDNEWWIK
jgi:hypothetical protein